MQIKKKKPLRVGLTGGIASGKSTVAKLFELLSVPVYDSDARAKKIIHTSDAIRQQIIQHFGQESYKQDGSYNRSYIADIVFQNKEKLLQINQIVHPAIFTDQNQWIEKQTAAYVIIESALIYQTNTQDNYHKIIVVHAPDDIRLQRIITRDHLTLQEAKTRLNSQQDQSFLMQQADILIANDEQSLIEQVMRIHRQLSEMIA